MGWSPPDLSLPFMKRRVWLLGLSLPGPHIKTKENKLDHRSDLSVCLWYVCYVWMHILQCVDMQRPGAAFRSSYIVSQGGF